MKRYEHRFDFERGYLVKSPCRDCETRPSFPNCLDGCGLIDELHAAMCGQISSTRRFSNLESFAVSWEGQRRK